MRSQPTVRGFTRMELLTVVLLLGVLVSLLLPGCLQSENLGRRVQCNNNLHNIAISLQNYHDTYKMFPMGAMHSGANPGGDPPITAALGPSWWFGILPFTEGRNIYDKITITQRQDGPAKHEFCADDMYAAGILIAKLVPEFMRCPTSPLPVMEASDGPITLPTYVGIAGGCDIDPNSQDYQAGAGKAPGLVAPVTTAVYQNKAKGTGAAAGGIVTSSGMLPPCEHVSIGKSFDGTSNTIIVGEQADFLQDQDPSSSTKYHGDPGWTVGGTGPGGGWLSGTNRVDPVPQVASLGGTPATWGADCWNITTVRYRLNYTKVLGGTPQPGCSENHGINNPLQSPHAGGLSVVMTDGSVQFISQTMDLVVLLRLAIRDDGQPVKIGDEIIGR
ncbi:MAG: DUF1559 domain-containing protein [Planctomycetota bacterium]|nr:DUF1559 domain-containing protein [Planctomycetota bacterium]